MKQTTALRVQLALQALRGESAHMWRDESGIESVEYAILVALIVVGSIGAWAGLHESIGVGFDRVVASVGGGDE